MILAPQQITAIDMIQDWLRRGREPVFRLFGYAGSGKTSLAKLIAEGFDGLTIFAAYTGKAAHVLTQKGCEAFTVHQLIYNPQERSKKRLQDLEVKLAQAEDPEEKHEIEQKIKKEHKRLAQPKFSLNEDSDIREASLIILDEVSMINSPMAHDLLSFNVPLLVLGDPAQLPPVRGTGFFINAKPDYMLTEIHRQARDNPILRLATDIRRGIMPKVDGKMVVPWGSISGEEVIEYEQIIVGYNKTRRATNFRVRELKGFSTEMPASGDRLVCLRNDHDVGLLNGAIWNVDTAIPQKQYIDLILRDEVEKCVAVEAHKDYFVPGEVDQKPWWVRKEAHEFDYGYALTCHKAQGSEYDDVLVFDESEVAREHKWKHLYTAVTRAKKDLKLVIRI